MSNTFVTPWTTYYKAVLSMGFPRQEYWSRLSFPSLADIPSTGIELEPPASPALTGRFFTTEPLGKPDNAGYQVKFEFQIKNIVFSINVS